MKTQRAAELLGPQELFLFFGQHIPISWPQFLTLILGISPVDTGTGNQDLVNYCENTFASDPLAFSILNSRIV